MAINGNASYTTLTGITVTTTITGASQMRFSYDASNRTARTGYTSSPLLMNILAGDGNKPIYAQFSGALGLYDVVGAITLDTTAPTASVFPSTGVATNMPVRVALTGMSETLSGLNATGHLFTGNGTFIFTYSDLVGHT